MYARLETIPLIFLLTTPNPPIDRPLILLE
jgi:hypothetical protein